jgi:hypothetical protein
MKYAPKTKGKLSRRSFGKLAGVIDETQNARLII